MISLVTLFRVCVGDGMGEEGDYVSIKYMWKSALPYAEHSGA